MITNRRDFIKNTAVAAAGASFLLPFLSNAAESRDRHKKITIPDNGVIVFQGDSITDASRDKANLNYNDLGAFGSGYAGLVASQLLNDHPDKKLKIYNKGVSGNKVFQLADRWDKDCLDLKPDVLSVMVGINDYWHTKTYGYKGTLKTYKDDYIKLLQRTKDKFPDVQLIIAEPYGVKGVKHIDESWYPYFDEYRKACHEVSGQFDAIFIPLQQLFDNAQKAMPGKYWTADGVHPSFAGIQIMATAWLSAFK